jgi:enoyl-CoA hydratase
MEKVSHIQWEMDRGIGILTLDSPPENYLSDPEFVPVQTLASWTSDPALRGILIRGSGRHFSAGADVKALFRMISEGRDLEQRIRAGHEVIRQLALPELPLVAAIRGTCFGGGLEISLGCDIRIASENALLAFPESGQGLMPGMGGTFRLPGLTGVPAALQVILGGDMLSAREALDLKIIDRVVPKDELFPAAMALLLKMTAGRPLPVIRSIVRSVRLSRELPLDSALEEETKLFCRLAQAEALRRLTEEA